MRQFAIECGYSEASLQERVYSREPSHPLGAMAGILIYTATSDSEGTLGGLVSLGAPDLLGQHIKQALEGLQVCTSEELFSMLAAVSFSLHETAESKCPEIVSTVPTGKDPIRQTRQVLKELFDNAEREIFIVSFVVFDIPELIESLVGALSRNVKLVCFLEDSEQSGGKTFSNAANNLTREVFAAADV